MAVLCNLYFQASVEEENGNMAIYPLSLGASPYLKKKPSAPYTPSLLFLTSKYSGHQVGKRNLIYSQEKQMT